MFVPAGGLDPKITSFALPKNEGLERCRACAVAGESWTEVAVAAVVIRRGKVAEVLDAAKKRSQSELLEILTSPKVAVKWIRVGIA